MDANREEKIDAILAVYEGHYPNRTTHWMNRRSIALFVELMPLDEIIDAMDIACLRVHVGSTSVFRYFCGVCWRKIERAKQQ